MDMKIFLLMSIVLNTLYIQPSSCQGPQLYFNSFKEDAAWVVENSNLSLSFWIDVSSCKDPDALFRLEVQTRRSDGKYDDDGRVVRLKNKCEVTFKNSVQCISDDGPAELNKKVNSSHTEVIWTMSWKDEDSKKIHTRQSKLKLHVLREIVKSVFKPVIDLKTTLPPEVTVPARFQDEPVTCELEYYDGCIQNVLFTGVNKSTFDVYYFGSNGGKEVVVGCDLLQNGNFTCLDNCPYRYPKSGVFSISVSSANICTKEELKFTHEHTTVDCKYIQGRAVTAISNVTLSPERSEDDVSTVSVAVPVGLIAAVIISAVIGIVLYKRGCKKEIKTESDTLTPLTQGTEMQSR